MGGQFFSEDRGAFESYLAAQPATCRLLRDVLLKDCNISESASSALRIHRCLKAASIWTEAGRSNTSEVFLATSTCPPWHWHRESVTVSGTQSRCAFHIAVSFFPFMCTPICFRYKINLCNRNVKKTLSRTVITTRTTMLPGPAKSERSTGTCKPRCFQLSSSQLFAFNVSLFQVFDTSHYFWNVLEGL